MKVFLSFIPAFGLFMFLITGCASSGKTTNNFTINKDTATFTGDYNQIVQLAADALQDQGLHIDRAHAVNMSKYVIFAHLTNTYMTNSPYSGDSDLPQESEAQVTITYVTDMETKVYVKEPKVIASGLRANYSKDVKNHVFHYIADHLKQE